MTEQKSVEDLIIGTRLAGEYYESPDLVRVANECESAVNALAYISKNITAAERAGVFDKVDYPSATMCVDLLRAIRAFCDTRQTYDPNGSLTP